MKVLHVTETYASGVASAIDRYCDSTMSLEHHLLWGAGRAAHSAAPAKGRYASVQAMPSDHLARVRAVRALVRDLAPDVVHAHSTYAGLYVRVAVVRTRARPLVYTPHCFAFERRTSAPWLRLLLWLTEGLLALNTSCIAACSSGEAQRVRRLAPWVRVHVVPQLAPTWTAASAVPRQRTPVFGVGGGPIRVVAAGRLEPQKDPQYFLDVVRGLRQSGLTVEATWVGDGDAALRDALILGGVGVTGWMAREQVPTVMGSHDVYVHTAAWEGFPVTLLEALFAGCVPILRSTPSQGRVQAPLQFTSVESAVALIRKVHLKVDRGPFIEQWQRTLTGHTEEAQRDALLLAYGRVA